MQQLVLELIRASAPYHAKVTHGPIEYGKDTIEIQNSSISKGDRVLICDDLLATGGTAEASGKLIEKMGGKIAGFAFIVELTELKGIKKISKYNGKSLVKY